ncbi:MAG: hypothetical protein ACRDH1_05215 [Actinomycetota bacterium]
MPQESTDLPGHVRDRIVGLGIPYPERFAAVPFPSLGDRSILEALGERRGEAEVLSLLSRMEGYLGRPA